jgi:peptidoglycan LD-endopeptidase CwlK
MNQPLPKHSNRLETCQLCEEKLKTVHADLAAIFREVIKRRFHDAHISEGWRGEFEQRRAFAEGKSKAPWPLSKHNKLDDQGNPCSLAIDLFELASNGLACWRWGYFKAIAEELDREDLPIRWGGDWNGNGIKDKNDFDAPHFEIIEEYLRRTE